jgi:phosphoglycerate dehydrogenase-like enzyme
MEKILIVDVMAEKRMTALRALLPPGFEIDAAKGRDDEAVKAAIVDADYAIAGQRAVSGDILRAAKKLKVLHKWGVGVDNLDVDTARELGIRVARTPGSNAGAVAEMAIGLMLAAGRQIAYGHAEMQKGEWRGGRLPRENFMLAKKTIGIVGFGAIGQMLARRLAGFECEILYFQRNRVDAKIEAELRARHVPLAELLARADIVSLHCPLTPETANMIDAKALASMKRTAILINLARGGVVAEDDLIAALQGGVIHAAAMDVFEIEPLPADSKLIGLNNLVLTPHLGAIAAELFEPTVRRMFANFEAVSKGGAPAPGDLVV